MKSRTLLVLFTLTAASFAAADPHNWHLSATYSFELDPVWRQAGTVVTNLIAYTEGGSVDGSYGWGTTSWPHSSDETTIEQTFDTAWFDLEAAEPTVAQSLFLGIVQDLPNDAPGQKHVVMFMDPTAAALSQGIAWGTLFRNTREEDVIADIERATSGGSEPVVNAAFDRLSDFAHGDGTTGILGPGGASQSVFFGSSFAIMTFSDGQRLGSGVSSVATTITPVPEPASLAAFGFGVVALSRRRRRA